MVIVPIKQKGENMKKLVLMLVVVLAMVAGTSELSAKGVSNYGVKVGMNLATAIGDDTDIDGADKGFRTGMAFGGFVTYSINDEFAVQPELLYSMKGATYEAKEGDGEITNKLDYLQIPILAKYQVQNFNFFAGPALAFNLTAESEVEVNGNSEDIDWDDVAAMEFGLIFGAGVDFPLTKGAITIDARYDLGLTSADDSDAEADIKNGVISVLLGYSFL